MKKSSSVRPLVIFNPHAHAVREAVQMRVMATKITDEMGNEIPLQFVRGEQTNQNGDIYLTSFIAEVPAYGYRVYRAFLGEAGDTFDGVVNAIGIDKCKLCTYCWDG